MGSARHLCGTQKIELVGDIDEGAIFNLSMTPGNPVREAILIELRMLAQREIDGVDNEVQEVSFVSRVAILTSLDDPI